MEMNFLLLGFLVFLLEAGSVYGKVVGAVVMPHGGIALDPTHFNSNDSKALSDAWAIHNACIKAGQLVGRLQPDLLVLSTPHGIADLTMFSFYVNSKASGYADTDNCACPPCCYNVSVSIDESKTSTIIKQLQLLGANVSGMVSYGGAEPFPLRWGEVIPLHFVLPYLHRDARTIIVSQPNRRYTESVAMIPELLTLGAELFHSLEQLSERVVVIVSADLAHTHLSSGPYGFSNSSEPFDMAVGEWANTLNYVQLLQVAASFVNRALSCGYTGLVMLHGLIDTLGTSIWTPLLYANVHPSYYGMMVASFERT